MIGDSSAFTGAIVERSGGALDISVAGGGTLILRNGAITAGANPAGYNIGLSAHNVDVNTGGLLNLTLSQAFNQNSNIAASPIVSATGEITLGVGDAAVLSPLGLNFGGFVSSPTASSSFTLLSAPQLNIGNIGQLEQQVCATSVPFLFQQSTNCLTYDNTPAAGANQTLVLTLTPKTVGRVSDNFR